MVRNWFKYFLAFWNENNRNQAPSACQELLSGTTFSVASPLDLTQFPQHPNLVGPRHGEAAALGGTCQDAHASTSPSAAQRCKRAWKCCRCPLSTSPRSAAAGGLRGGTQPKDKSPLTLTACEGHGKEPQVLSNRHEG